MINHLEASVMFGKAAERAMQFIRLHGFCYPLMYIINKSHPIVIDFEHPSILNSESDETPANDLDIYRTVIGLKMETDEDEDAVKLIAKEICNRYDPDGIGAVLSCLYNEYPVASIPRKGGLSLDPEAIRVLHINYWIKGNANGYMQIIPYISRGEKKGLLPALMETEETERYDVNFLRSLWEPSRKGINAKIPDPYIRRTI